MNDDRRSNVNEKYHQIFDYLSSLVYEETNVSLNQNSEHSNGVKDLSKRSKQDKKGRTVPHNKLEFQNRLSSFKFGSSINVNLSPLLCAKFGWILKESQILQCTTCFALISTSLPQTYELEAYETFLIILKNRLRIGHEEWCGWNQTSSPDDFVHPPPVLTVRFLKNLTNDAISLSNIGSSLPYFDYKEVLALLNLDQKHLLVLFSHNDELSSSRITAAILTLLGWTFKGQQTIKCSICLRTAGLWNYLPLSKQKEFEELQIKYDQKQQLKAMKIEELERLRIEKENQCKEERLEQEKIEREKESVQKMIDGETLEDHTVEMNITEEEESFILEDKPESTDEDISSTNSADSYSGSESFNKNNYQKQVESKEEDSYSYSDDSDSVRADNEDSQDDLWLEAVRCDKMSCVSPDSSSSCDKMKCVSPDSSSSYGFISSPEVRKRKRSDANSDQTDEEQKPKKQIISGERYYSSNSESSSTSSYSEQSEEQKHPKQLIATTVSSSDSVDDDQSSRSNSPRKRKRDDSSDSDLSEEEQPSKRLELHAVSQDNDSSADSPTEKAVDSPKEEVLEVSHSKEVLDFPIEKVDCHEVETCSSSTVVSLKGSSLEALDSTTTKELLASPKENTLSNLDDKVLDISTEEKLQNYTKDALDTNSIADQPHEVLEILSKQMLTNPTVDVSNDGAEKLKGPPENVLDGTGKEVLDNYTDTLLNTPSKEAVENDPIKELLDIPPEEVSASPENVLDIPPEEVSASPENVLDNSPEHEILDSPLTKEASKSPTGTEENLEKLDNVNCGSVDNDDESEDDLKYHEMKKSLFDPLREHRPWCGWISKCSSSSGDKMSPWNHKYGYSLLPPQLHAFVFQSPVEGKFLNIEKYNNIVDGLRAVRETLSDWELPL